MRKPRPEDPTDRDVARPCTCHPDDNPPVPCPQKYALAECRAAWRAALIDQLDRSFQVLPTWAKAATKHAMWAPEQHPETDMRFESFREVIEAAGDRTLEILRDDFEGNGDLLPAVPRQ